MTCSVLLVYTSNLAIPFVYLGPKVPPALSELESPLAVAYTALDCMRHDKLANSTHGTMSD